MVPVFPLGVFKDVEREPWFHLDKREFKPDRVLEVLQARMEAPPRFAEGFPEHLAAEDIAIKLAGAGGDGAQTAAMILAKAAINEGFDATHIPSYGPESRGGTSYADVHVARQEVLSPASPRPHVLVAFNAPSLSKFGPLVAPNGTVLYDSSVITEVPALQEGVRVHAVPFRDIAHSLGRPVVKNVVALGALQAATRILPEETMLTAIRIGLHDKCAMIPLNEQAFRWGAKAAREKIASLATSR
jgi:Pyruvate/2-oxoacid:ferredoxin oxidoreductase gamma subunit